MKVLVVGFGSAGRRHVRNLAAMAGIGGITVYTRFADRCETSPAGRAIFVDATAVPLEECCRQAEPDFAIIANQTGRHLDAALVLAARGVHLLVEKPVSHNLMRCDQLEGIAQSRGVKIAIGYNLRYLPVIRRIKDLLSQRVLGDLYFGSMEVGQFLPSWRPDSRYTDSYSARAEEGGGVALDLSHEVDYMRYWFGEPNRWKTLKSRAGDLKIDTDDLFEGIYRFPEGFVCHVHMDYLQHEARRVVRIVGSRGSIDCDIIGKRMAVVADGRSVHIDEEGLFDVEETYREELRSFIGALSADRPPDISLEDGVRALKLLEDGHD